MVVDSKMKILLIDPRRRLSSVLLDYLTALPVGTVGVMVHLDDAGERLKALKPDFVLVEGKDAHRIDELHSAGWTKLFPDTLDDREPKLEGSSPDRVADQLVQLLRETETDLVEIYRSVSSVLSGEHGSPLLNPAAMGIVTLPTLTGLRFFPVKQIVLFQYEKGVDGERGGWLALLSDFSRVKLRGNTTAQGILALPESHHFVPISPSLIVNLAFIEHIGYKSRLCRLASPFDQLILPVSRTQLSSLKERFDVV